MKLFRKTGGRLLAFLLTVVLLFASGAAPSAAASSPGGVEELVEVWEFNSDQEDVQVSSASVEGNASRDGSLYSVLSARQKLCYTALQNISIDEIMAAPNHAVNVNISGINDAKLNGYSQNGGLVPADSASKNLYESIVNDMQAAVGGLRYDRPDMLWLDGTVSSIIGYTGYTNSQVFTISSVQYQFSLPYGGQEKSLRQRMLSETQAIANGARLQADRYNEVKYIHDVLCARSEYNSAVANNSGQNNTVPGRLAHSAYSALIGGDAYEPVCDGYSKAFKIVCDLLDIPCVLAISQGHMWNNVKMDDGLWYNLDVTWDDGWGMGRTAYFLVGSQTVIGGVPFSQQKDHVEIDPFSPYKVTGAKYPKKNTRAYQYIGKDYPPTTYPDVPCGTWYYESVETVSQMGYFSGDNHGMFNPGKKITRAEFAKVIANVMGVNTNAYKGTVSFKDVSPASWYSGVAYWAKAAGIMHGDAKGFRPNDPISRQEMCVVLVRALDIQSGGKSITFSDQKDIAGWAAKAVGICSSAGLIQGSKGKFNPRSPALRQEAATIFARYAKMIGKQKAA